MNIIKQYQKSKIAVFTNMSMIANVTLILYKRSTNMKLNLSDISDILRQVFAT